MAAEEKQLQDKVMEDGGAWKRGGDVYFFSYLGGVESYLESYLDKS